MADAEFFFDPVCPWAWLTSRWVTEVAEQRSLDVEWRFICLRIVNEQRDYEREFPQGYTRGHTIGQELLRVAAALKAEQGNDAVARYYTAVGTALHTRGRRDELQPEGSVPGWLAGLDLDLPGGLADAAHDESWDADLRASTDEALSRAGKDVGTPIITFGPPDGPSFFGPVISRIPRGDEAVALWDATERIARFPGFAELKRSIRERPVFE